MTEDLAAWLTAIWDEHEEIATYEQIPVLDADGRWTSVRGGWNHDIAARQQTLARIAADRQILELHSGVHDCPELRTGTYPDDWPEAASWGKPGGQWRHAFVEHFDEDEPCPTVRLLARPHADRPGYNPEWRP